MWIFTLFCNFSFTILQKPVDPRVLQSNGGGLFVGGSFLNPFRLLQLINEKMTLRSFGVKHPKIGRTNNNVEYTIF